MVMSNHQTKDAYEGATAFVAEARSRPTRVTEPSTDAQRRQANVMTWGFPGRSGLRA